MVKAVAMCHLGTIGGKASAEGLQLVTEILKRIDRLNPTEFENFVFDCAGAAGLKNLIWRTPGADGGRDIEGVAYVRDLSGQELVQRWYVECKHYSSSIDWPTVWEKIAYADVQNADALLIATNSNPSPRCETEVSSWNEARRKPLIRFWRGYDLPNLVRDNPRIGVVYGLLESKTDLQASALPLSLIVSKIAQAAYTAVAFGSDAGPALETAASLAELLSQRLDDLKNYGRFVKAAATSGGPMFDWLESTGAPGEWEDVCLRAVLSFVRHLLGAQTLSAEFQESKVTLKAAGSTLCLSEKGIKDLDIIAQWANLEVNLLSNAPPSFEVDQRK